METENKIIEEITTTTTTKRKYTKSNKPRKGRSDKGILRVERPVKVKKEKKQKPEKGPRKVRSDKGISRVEKEINIVDGRKNKVYPETGSSQMPEYIKQKISDSMKGKNAGNNHSEETKAKMSELKKDTNHPMWGKNHTFQTKEKMSEAKRGTKWINNREINKRVKEELLEEFLIDGWLLGRI